jgi:hypothetical protein
MLFFSYGLFLSAQVAGWFPLGRAFHAQGVQPLAGLILLAGVLAGELCEVCEIHPFKCVDLASGARDA